MIGYGLYTLLWIALCAAVFRAGMDYAEKRGFPQSYRRGYRDAQEDMSSTTYHIHTGKKAGE
jgi:hypothetical protein